MPKHWHPHHVGRATFEAHERIREAVLGLARSHSSEPREIEGVVVQVFYAGSSRHFIVSDEHLPPGAPLTTVVRAIVSIASKQGLRPLL